jgi:hypothetical protein
MTTPISLPFLTEPDPDLLGEGSLDPLGLTPIADHLADLIAPNVTARMTRVRFLTAIAIGATLMPDLRDEVAIDGKTPPYLALEWLVVEALARRRPSSETQGVPGIQKARRMLNRSWSAHLDAASYLQVPKVFGFHGVYKRLARAVRHIDGELLSLPSGEELVGVWEREQRLPGFLNRTGSTPGGRLARALVSEVRRALVSGGVVTPNGSHVWSKVANAIGPNDVGRRERKLLWRALVDEREPIRRELLLALRFVKDWAHEADALRSVAVQASPDLRLRLAAIDAYERVAWLLTSVFQAMRVASTGQGTFSVNTEQLVDHESVVRASRELPPAMAKATEHLDPYGEGPALELALGRFAEPLRPRDLLEATLEHHEQIQAAKDGKRPWLERTDKGFFVRDAYRTSDDPPPQDTYIHPYRVYALSSFIADVGVSG